MGQFLGPPQNNYLAKKGLFGSQSGPPPPPFSWTQQASSGGTISPNSAAGGVIVAPGGGRAVNVSLDGGVTFNPAPGIVGNTPQYAAFGHSGVWIVPADSSTYFNSTDNATTFNGPFPFPVALGVNTMGYIASDGVGHFVVFAITFGGPTNNNYAISADNGATWSVPQLYSNNGWSAIIWDGTQFVALAFQATTSLPVIATSADAGASWTETVLAAGGVPPYSGSLSFNSGRYLIGAAFGASDPLIRTATTPAGLAIAADVNTGLAAGSGLGYSIAAAGVMWAFDSAGGVARSLDGGATWVSGALNMPFGRRASGACYDAVHGEFVACSPNDGVTTFP